MGYIVPQDRAGINHRQKAISAPVMHEGHSHQSPESLIFRIAHQADREAFATLFSIYAPKIKAFVMGQGLNAAAAEDLAQDVMLKVWRKAPLFNAERASAATWIYSIARNLRIDLARQSVRSNNLPDDLWEPDPETPADQTLIEAQSAHAVTQLLSQLPEAQLQILRLSYYENLSHSEIARNLSLPLGTVKSRLRLALAVLKGLLSSPKGRS